MSDRRVAIRLGTEGKATIVTDLNEIGVTGDAAFNRLARSAERAGKDAVDALAFAERQAKKLEALLPGLNPTRLDANVGIRTDVGKSAQASASVFSAAYEQMEQRAEALRRAIDPVYAAQDRFNREIGEARALVSAGVLSLDEYVAKLRQEQAALDAVSDGHVRTAKGAGAQRFAMQQLSFQAQDVFTQLSMGANVFQVLAIQGGQAAGAFANVGGKAEAVARFLIGPWGLAITAGLLVLGPLVAKLLDFSDAVADGVEKLQKQARETAASGRAQDAFARTVEGVTLAIDAQNAALVRNLRGQQDNERHTLALAIANKQLAQNTLDTVNRDLAEARKNLRAVQGSTGEGAILGASDIADRERRVKELEADQARVQAAIDKADIGIRSARIASLQREVSEGLDPLAAATGRYERALSRLNRERAAGTLSVTDYRKQLREEQQALDAAQKAASASKKSPARDQETLTASAVATMLRSALPGVQVTSTTGGKHVANSYHYKNQAVDFVPAGGMSSMTKADVRELFESRGIDVVELLGPGDKGHSDHFHVAWTKGKLALDDFTDAAKRAKAAKEDLAKSLDTLQKGIVAPDFSSDDYRDILQRIDGERAERQRVRDYAAGMIVDQRDQLAMGERELQLAGANDNYRQNEIAKLRLILDLRRQGVEAGSDDEKQILENAAALDEINARLRRQQAVWGEIKDTGRAIIDRLFDPSSAETWGERVKGILNDLKNEFIKLALLNPLKNALYGDGLPTLSGVLGKLGGLFGGSSVTAPGFDPNLLKNIPTVRPFATGTEYAPGGAALVGEEGPEIVSIPRGARVTTAGDTRRLLGANDNGGTTIIINANDAVLASTVRGWVAEGMSLAATRGAAGGASMAATMEVKRRRQAIPR